MHNGLGGAYVFVFIFFIYKCCLKNTNNNNI